MTTVTVPDPQALAQGRADDVLPVGLHAGDGPRPRPVADRRHRVWNWLMPFGGYKESADWFGDA